MRRSSHGISSGLLIILITAIAIRCQNRGAIWWIFVRPARLPSKAAGCAWNPAGAYTASDVHGRSNSRSTGSRVMSGPTVLLVEALRHHHGPKSSRRRYTSWWSTRATAARA